MNRSLSYTCPALVVAGALIADLAPANDHASGKLDAKVDEMMKKAEAACTPGPAHKVLEPLVGDWNAEVKFWMAPAAGAFVPLP